MVLAMGVRTILGASIARFSRSSLASLSANCSSIHCSNHINLVTHSRFLHGSVPLLGERRFSDSHEWCQVDDNLVATVGLSAFAEHAIGNAVFIELPDLGKDLEKGDYAGVIENTKAVSEVYAPISGKCVEVNTKLNNKPELIHISTYDEGWIFKLKIKDLKEFEKLMTEAEYEKYVEIGDGDKSDEWVF